MPPPALFACDPDKCEYSTVDECASTVSQVASDQRHVVVPEDQASVNKCQVYSDVSNAMPDISPYACFYGAPSHQVLKVGWLDKLSPQG